MIIQNNKKKISKKNIYSKKFMIFTLHMKFNYYMLEKKQTNK